MLALLVPLAGAHGADPAYDPLVVSFHGFLSVDGALVEAQPEPGARALPAAPLPPGAAPELVFTLRAPVAFAAGGPFEVDLTLRADKPVVARDAEGNALELRIEPGGAPVRIALPDAVLAPGAVTTAAASLPAPARAFAEGEALSLHVRALMPGLAEDALSIVVGGDAPSRLDIRDMRVPSPADLRLQDVPHTEFVLGVDRFEPPADHAVNVYVVRHDRVDPPANHAYRANATYVVFHGIEDEGVAAHRHATREARISAAHEFSVNGISVRVHPGLGVVARAPIFPVIVECVRNCPAEGFQSVIGSGRAEPSEPPSALVPPPRDTTGIPVSEDAPQDARVPMPAALAVLGLLAVAVARRRA